MRMNRAYPSRPLIGVGVADFKNGTVLLVQRAGPPRQGKWSLPGGVQHLGETVFKAGQREAAEETGLTV
ncbi:MAG: putative NUDIX hydrolase, partial [Rhodospirillaceae bacterium]